MLDLLVIMLERVGMIVAVAFILTRFGYLQKKTFKLNETDYNTEEGVLK